MQFLMIARLVKGTPIEQALPHVKAEALKSWEHYADGSVRQMHYIADMSGVVFLWEAPDIAAVNKAIDEFPMKRAGVLNFEVLSLKPYTAIGELFAPAEE